MARLLQSSGNFFADETIVNGTTINDIDEKLFKDFIEKKHEKSIYSNTPYLLPFQGVGSGIRRAYSKYSDLELINDTERELFISIIKRPKLE